MLFRDYLKKLTTYTYEWADALKNAEFHFLDSKTFESLQIRADKPFSFWAVEGLAIITVNLTREEGLPFLTSETIEEELPDVDNKLMFEVAPVILFYVDDKYMVQTYCSPDVYIDIKKDDNRATLNVLLKDTAVYRY